MKTEHRIYFTNSNNLQMIEDTSVNLVVTSPPYPMISMWDDIFASMNTQIREALNNENGEHAFELMNKELDKVWDELHRVLKPGGILCINIGDATRSIDGEFHLYSNHSRILSYLLSIGFTNLPNILWHKPTNSPTKFMGSGMYPPGAYVTLEHEYILIFRKGNRRRFKTETDKLNRRSSGYFWEERNTWFSDIWNLKGSRQQLDVLNSRERSGAFPFELVYRLINMYSVKNDTILDPFLGTATTTIAAIASGRNSIGIEIDENLKERIYSIFDYKFEDNVNSYIFERFKKHIDFVQKKTEMKGESAFKYINKHYEFPVMTRQEMDILINYTSEVYVENGNIYVEYNESID